MSDEMQKMQAQIEALRGEVADLRASLMNMQVAPESGGGFVSMSGNIPMIRINALTPSGVQLPG